MKGSVNMKKLVVLSLLTIFCFAGCNKTPEVEQEAIVNETKDIKGIMFTIKGKDLMFPQDFTRENLQKLGYVSEEQSEQFIVEDNKEVDINYGSNLSVSYYPDDMIVTSTDSMYMTGLTYVCNDEVVLMDGIDLSIPPEGNLFEYETDDYFVSVAYQDGVLTSIKLKTNRSSDYYRAKEACNIKNSYEYDKVFEPDGSLVYRLEDTEFTYPSDAIPRVLSHTEIPFKIGYTQDVPQVCMRNTDNLCEEVGILLSEEGMEVGNLKVGGSIEDLEKEINIKDVNLVELTSEKTGSKVYVQSDGLYITDIALVKE